MSPSEQANSSRRAEKVGGTLFFDCSRTALGPKSILVCNGQTRLERVAGCEASLLVKVRLEIENPKPRKAAEIFL